MIKRKDHEMTSQDAKSYRLETYIKEESQRNDLQDKILQRHDSRIKKLESVAGLLHLIEKIFLPFFQYAQLPIYRVTQLPDQPITQSPSYPVTQKSHIFSSRFLPFSSCSNSGTAILIKSTISSLLHCFDF